MDKVYRSKVDWWVGLIIAIGVVVILGNGIFLLVKPPPDGSPAILAPIAIGMFLMAAFMAWILFSTRYTITARDLLVRSAFFRWRIPLEQITEVRPSHNPLSSPALSLDRLRVNYERPNRRTTFILISPKAKDQFLNELAEAAGLEMEADRLVRNADDDWQPR